MTEIGNACSLNSLLVYTTECDSLHSSWAYPIHRYISGHLVKQPIGACWASSSRFNGHRKPVSLQQYPIPVWTRAQSVAFTASHRIASRHSLSILYCRAVTLYVLTMHGTEPRTQHCGSLPLPCPPSQRSPTNLGSGFKHNTASHSTVPHTSIHHQRVCMYV
jgi:hypothetical protein